MKTELFTSAIKSRNKLRFLYNLEEVIMEPYYVTQNRAGKKVLYGRLSSSYEIKMFEYEQIVNIKILDNTKFSPIIPILPIAS
jgi:hypothetical protein